MTSEDELRKRIEELEKGLAEAKWRADFDAQQARQNAEVAKMRQESKKENNTFWIFIAICSIPFILLLLK